MTSNCTVLILGASYGSLLGLKLALAGHTVKLVCLPEEASLINDTGAIVRLPVRGVDGLIELNSRDAPGALSAVSPAAVDLADFDLVGLAMQEPQYRAAELRDLLARISAAGVPCLSIMNMPPLAYLKRIPGIDVQTVRSAYTDASIWDEFKPGLMTLCSPDPQASRPPDEPMNVLQVGLPTNFKAARFESNTHTAILRQLETDIDAIRYDCGHGEVELPVKLKLHDSIFVPLAKWSMLLTGNYRCIHKDGIRPIKDVVLSNVEESRSVYNWVVDLCVSLGANEDDLVPFEKYADAVSLLAKPSSAARALAAGARDIERVDRLVQILAAHKGMQSDIVDQTVTVVDSWITNNRGGA